MNYIGFFVTQVEKTYHKHYSVNNGWGDHVRPTAVLIVHRFCGVSMHRTAIYFKCSTAAVSYAIDRLSGYECMKDEKFIKQYNQLLDLFIKSTSFYIRKRRFIT